MAITPEETVTGGIRNPSTVLMSVTQAGLKGEILIPWNAPRYAIVEALELLYPNFRHLTDFYRLDDSPRSPFGLVFGFTSAPDGEPPRPDGPVLTLRRGVLRDEILDALQDNGQWPFLVGYRIDTDTVTLTFDTERATTRAAAGGAGTAP